MSKSAGVIYILTNPSFPGYVKIGYADDINRRVAELNRSECTPFAFRVYATYAVQTRLTDMKLHKMIDRLNPSLRSQDTINGKRRIREFYAMSAEDAYLMLEAMAEIHGTKDRLVKMPDDDIPSDAMPLGDVREEDAAVRDAHGEGKRRAKRPKFSFDMIGISPGEQVEFWYTTQQSSGIMCTVADERHIEVDGQRYTLTAFAEKMTAPGYSIAGTRYFKYNGEWLNDIRKRLDV